MKSSKANYEIDRQHEYEEGSYSKLTVPCGGDEATDELAEYWYEKHLETVGGAPNLFTLLSATWDTLWDATCAVRKVEE